MNNYPLLLFSLLLLFSACAEQNKTNQQQEEATEEVTTEENWQPLFAEDLSNAKFPDGVWTVENGELTASEDQVIWSNQIYDNFVLDLEFKNASGTNSGVILYCSDRDNWIPNSVEVQIADDYHSKWSESPTTWQCGAIFGHLPAKAQQLVKKPGEWNHYVITCVDQNIKVELNGEEITNMDMSLWTSGTTNPDGSPIPEWTNTPFAELETKGYIGFQGKHGDAPIWFRNVKIREL